MKEYKIVCDRQMEYHDGKIENLNGVFPFIRSGSSNMSDNRIFTDKEKAKNRFDYCIEKAAEFDKHTANNFLTDKYAIRSTQTNIRIMVREVSPWSEL